jgi:hypothetical protein
VQFVVAYRAQLGSSSKATDVECAFRFVFLVDQKATKIHGGFPYKLGSPGSPAVVRTPQGKIGPYRPSFTASLIHQGGHIFPMILGKKN